MGAQRSPTLLHAAAQGCLLQVPVYQAAGPFVVTGPAYSDQARSSAWRWRRRRIAPRPASPLPSSSIEAGSGVTVAG
jgi:hypothetical protein